MIINLPKKFKLVVPQGLSEDIQQKLFSLGKEWWRGGKKIMHTNSMFLLVRDNVITHADTYNYFMNDVDTQVPQIDPFELLNYEDPNISIIDEIKTIKIRLTLLERSLDNDKSK